MSSCVGSTPGLNRRMREIIGTAQAGRCLRGLYHARTLAALERRGLVKTAGRSDRRGPVTLLTVTGMQVRRELRDRVDRRLAEHGWTPAASASFYRHELSKSIITRAAAMRRTGVSW